jgi:pectinesterase
MTAPHLILLALLAACSSSLLSAAAWEKEVSADGSADYKTLLEAILAAPTGTASEPSIIRIAPGVYEERLYIQREKRFLKLIGLGASPSEVVLAYHLYAGVLGEDGKKIGTFRTPSTQIDGDDVGAENITFSNTAGPNKQDGQALAIRIDGDRVSFRKCRFLGWQDTILLNRGRQYFEDCYVEGHVDFIFGGATAFFERCHIHALRDGYLTAASTPKEQAYGYVFRKCRVTGEPGVRTYLGRPWRVYASTLFINCEMGDVVRPEGWNNWNKPEAEKTARYGEFGSTGPGAASGKRVPWALKLSADEAAALTPEKVLTGNDGWKP